MFLLLYRSSSCVGLVVRRDPGRDFELQRPSQWFRLVQVPCLTCFIYLCGIGSRALFSEPYTAACNFTFGCVSLTHFILVFIAYIALLYLALHLA